MKAARARLEINEEDLLKMILAIFFLVFLRDWLLTAEGETDLNGWGLGFYLLGFWGVGGVTPEKGE